MPVAAAGSDPVAPVEGSLRHRPLRILRPFRLVRAVKDGTITHLATRRRRYLKTYWITPKRWSRLWARLSVYNAVVQLSSCTFPPSASTIQPSAALIGLHPDPEKTRNLLSVGGKTRNMRKQNRATHGRSWVVLPWMPGVGHVGGGVSDLDRPLSILRERRSCLGADAGRVAAGRRVELPGS